MARCHTRRPAWRLISVLIPVIVCWVAFWWANDPSRHFARGLAALRQHDPERVEYELMLLADATECEAHASLLAGWLLLQRGLPEQAVEELQFAPDDPQLKSLALALIGRACYQSRRFRLAEATLQSALKAQPDEIEAHRWLAAAYYDIGNMPLALEHLNRVAELDKSDPRPNRLVGQIQQEAGNVEEAVANYQESQRRDPNQADKDSLLVDLARCQMKQHRYNDAIATLTQGSPAPDTWSILAECHLMSGQVDEAQQLVDQALAVDPDHANALYVASLLAKQLGKREQVVKLLRHAVETYPAAYDVRYAFTQALKAAGRDDEAQREMEAAEDLRLVSEELAQLKTRAMFDTSDAQLRFNIGVLCVRLNMREAAKSWFESTLVLDRDHVQAHQALRALAAAMEE